MTQFGSSPVPECKTEPRLEQRLEPRLESVTQFGIKSSLERRLEQRLESVTQFRIKSILIPQSNAYLLKLRLRYSVINFNITKVLILCNNLNAKIVIHHGPFVCLQRHMISQRKEGTTKSKLSQLNSNLTCSSQTQSKQDSGWEKKQRTSAQLLEHARRPAGQLASNQ